jgi:hypothetical protein
VRDRFEAKWAARSMTGRVNLTPGAERQLNELDDWITKAASAGGRRTNGDCPRSAPANAFAQVSRTLPTMTVDGR